MKLYLSSYRLGENPQKLKELAGVNKKAAVIANAMDFLEDETSRKESVDREIADLKTLGFEAVEIDLRNYFGNGEKLNEDLKSFVLVWVRGGNVFILARAFKQSGMSNWLKKQRSNKDLVYGAYSAGVCVLSPELKGLELVDNPSVVPNGYKDELDWNGVGLINFAFAPHYMSDHPESAAVNKLMEWNKNNNVEFKTARDGEVIILETA